MFVVEPLLAYTLSHAGFIVCCYHSLKS